MGGYKSLLVYRTSVTIYDFNGIFCERFLSNPKYRRTVEQMAQVWKKDNPKVLRIRAFRESVETPTNLTHLANWTNLSNVTESGPIGKWYTAIFA